MEKNATEGRGFETVTRLAEQAAPRCIEFLHDLVTVPSPSRSERLACERVMREMELLGYRDVHLDEMGNVLGRVGSGPRVLAYDAHIDTVGISNPTHWRYDPFRGIVTGGTLFGRGASDQKGGLAAVVHGVALADQVGLPDDLTVWVTATVNGEDCVGLAWQYLLNETPLRPEVVIIAMPSHLGVCYGQRGRMEVEIATSGVSTHGSQPDRGENAIYAMMPVIEGLNHLHRGLEVDHPMLGRGSLAALAQMREVAEGASEESEVRLLHYGLPSWRGFTYPTDKVFPAWETAADGAAVGAAMATAEKVLERSPRIHRSAFSSNGCATAGIYGIPTIGFGPADELHSHTVNDQIPLAQLEPAMAFYAMFPRVYLESSQG
jgi:acetylornithine deacetylase/succinyl-diaminopimelate desuccinylase-like protein